MTSKGLCHSNNVFANPLKYTFNVAKPRRLPLQWQLSLPRGRGFGRHIQYRGAHNLSNEEFMSPLDRAPRIARVQEDRKGGFGLIVLAAIPVTAFLLGCWQVQRLTWKTDLIARFEDRIVRDPLPLPPTIDPGAIHDFDYRRVYATGRLRHDQEMLIGPRIHDGKDGYLVITPLERGRDQSKILMNRGWIAREKKDQNERRDGLPTGEVTVAGLLREPWKKNIFTPQNIPEKGQFYFPDVQMMAEWTESTPVWIEATLRPNLSTAIDFESKGIPMGRYPEVNLRNNHTQYIFTWWSLSLATTFMFYMFMRKRPSSIQARVRRSKEWQ